MTKTRCIKKWFSIALAICICLVMTTSITAFAAEETVGVESNYEDVTVTSDEGIMLLSSNFIFPKTDSFTTTKTLTQMEYFVTASNTSGYVLVNFTNDSTGATYKYSLMVLNTLTLNINIPAGTYNVSVVGGTYGTLSSIMFNLS